MIHRCIYKAVLIFLFMSSPLTASYFVSLKSSNVNLRVGPGKEYPIDWVLMQSSIPLLILAEFEDWKRVKLYDQTEGWIHKNMLSDKKTAIILSDRAILYKDFSCNKPIFRLQKNLIVKILKNSEKFIKIEAHNCRGWMEKKFLWGLAAE